MICRVSGSALDALLGAQPAFAQLLPALLGRMLADANNVVEDLALYRVKARVAHALARLAATDPTYLATITRPELACLVGTSREEVSRALGALRAVGLIACWQHRPGIVIHDVSSLAAH